MVPMYAIGMPSGMEWVFILVLVLIVFGAGRLPQVFRSMGEGMKAFRDAQKDGEGGPTDVTPPKELSKVDEAEEIKNKQKV
jgi:sec-independent protein translocase protein TatA